MQNNLIIYPETLKGGIVAGSSTRGLNYSLHTAESNSELEAAMTSRDRLVRDMGFEGLLTLDQVHSDELHHINPLNILNYTNNPYIEGDGLITTMKGILLGVLTADCVPVLFTDIKRSFAGIIHAGWKGIQKGIHMKMAAEIIKRLKVPAERLNVVLGPHIRKCCYEVGQGMINLFDSRYYEVRNSAARLDLGSIIMDDLCKTGIKEKNIYNSELCTKCGRNPGFYSYRGGDKNERCISFIGLK